MLAREISRFIHRQKLTSSKRNARAEYEFPWVNKSSYLTHYHAMNVLRGFSEGKSFIRRTFDSMVMLDPHSTVMGCPVFIIE